MDIDLSPASLRRVPATVALILVNVVVFAVLTLGSGLDQTLGLSGGWDAVAERPWTVVTVMFTAANVLHLAMAVVVVFLLGRELEHRAGSTHVLAVYVLTGLAGSLATTTHAELAGGGGLSLGASAAFLGLLGAVAVMPPSEEMAGFPLVPVLAAVVLVNVVGPLVDVGGWSGTMGHGAGIAVGAAYGWWLRSRVGDRSPSADRPAPTRARA